MCHVAAVCLCLRHHPRAGPTSSNKIHEPIFVSQVLVVTSCCVGSHFSALCDVMTECLDRWSGKRNSTNGTLRDQSWFLLVKYCGGPRSSQSLRQRSLRTGLYNAVRSVVREWFVGYKHHRDKQSRPCQHETSQLRILPFNNVSGMESSKVHRLHICQVCRPP